MSSVRYGFLFIKALLITTLFGGATVRGASPEERDSWIAANVVGTPEAYQNFLENHPAGEFAEKAFAAIANTIPAKLVKPPVVPVAPVTPPTAVPGATTVSTETGPGGLY